MIVFLTGVPGSGKTYKSVVSIYNNFSNSPKAKKDLKKDYINCYTNINELKYKELNNTFPLDLDLLKDKLTTLYNLYKEKNTDEVLIEKCKELDIYRSLFVIDEAHNIFDTNDKILIWWLSYHRHLFHDIFLITQNLSLIYTKYKSFSEYFYKAKPTTVSVFQNTFKYDVYINSRLSMNARSHTERIKKDEEIFNLYHSGDSVKSKNVLLKYLIFSFLCALSIVVFLVYFFLIKESSTSEESSSTKKTVIPQHVNYDEKKFNQRQENNKNIDDLIYIVLECNLKFCVYEDKIIPYGVINRLKEITYFEIIKKVKIDNFTYMYCFADSSINSFFNIRLNYENDTSLLTDTKIF